MLGKPDIQSLLSLLDEPVRSAAASAGKSLPCPHYMKKARLGPTRDRRSFLGH